MLCDFLDRIHVDVVITFVLIDLSKRLCSIGALFGPLCLVHAVTAGHRCWSTIETDVKDRKRHNIGEWILSSHGSKR